MTKIAMWSGPRNISTTLMRAFASRPDTFVSDEPFYAHYLYETGMDHPLRNEVISEVNTDWNSVANNLGCFTSFVPNNEPSAVFSSKTQAP